MLKPTAIRLVDEKNLQVTWSDGHICSYPLAYLRRNCPCAVCSEDRKAKGEFYIPLFTAGGLQLERIAENGHYAIQLFWKDGHHTGIYDFGFLRELCPEPNAAAATDGPEVGTSL